MFTPADFRRRLELASPLWVPFSPEAVRIAGLSEADKTLLLDPGLPSAAAPFLVFGDGLPPLREIQPDLGPEFDAFRCLGSNGCGDTIVVHQEDGRIVYHNHDRYMAEVFVNSGIVQLAQSLCLYEEARTGGWSFDFLRAIEAFDPRATETGCMWPAQAP